VEFKKKADTMNLSAMMFQLKSAQHAITKILEEIDLGNMHPRLFEVLAQLQSQIMQMPKDYQAYLEKMEQNYKKTKIEIEVSQKYGSSISIPEENLPVIRTSYGKLLPACDNVRVGIGFDDTRKFSGTVEIRFQYGTWRQIFPLPSWAKNFGLIIVIIAMMSWAVGDTYRPEDANEDSLEFGETDVSQ
jgi:hypothetical protein